MERVFALPEASALLETLTELLTALRAAHRAGSDTRGNGTHHPVSSNGSAAAAMSASGPAREIERLSSAINGLGVILRDPDTGLVDFASVRDGEQIYLCWRLGEERIGFWHPRETGFMGRLPL